MITPKRKNMKQRPLPLEDKLLLRKRSVIETINDQLKNISQIEHTRHRSVANFLVNLVCGLIAYCHQRKSLRSTSQTSSFSFYLNPYNLPELRLLFPFALSLSEGRTVRQTHRERTCGSRTKLKDPGLAPESFSCRPITDSSVF